MSALGWIWAHHPRTIPIPGARPAAQVRESAAAMQHGPLPAAAMQTIESLLN